MGVNKVTGAATELRQLLEDDSPGSEERWRAWADSCLLPDRLTATALAEYWKVVCDFDVVLARNIEHPIGVPEGTVVVAGSGKETFKTFNVSTAASILAAAAGVNVVKGVSRSVSAVSGASDVLDVLDVEMSRPQDVAERTRQRGVAFVSYSAFCPTYARRYDGVFEQLSPFSFFMPISVLAVRATAFVLGLADQRTDLAARTIRRTRPHIPHGVVVSAYFSEGEAIDERAPFGKGITAWVLPSGVECSYQHLNPPPPWWREAVAHRPTHRGNADMVLAALAPHGPAGVTELVELNAALIVSASQPGSSEDTVRRHVHEARKTGAAERLMANLRRHRRSS